MPKATPLIRKSKQDSAGLVPIWIRISDGHGTRFVSLGIRIPPSQWDEHHTKVKAGHRDSARINAIIAERMADLSRAVLDVELSGRSARATDLKTAITKPKAAASGDFFAYADALKEALRENEQLYLYRRQKSICLKLRTYTGEPLAFADLTVDLLNSYDRHLSLKYKNSRTTRVSNFRAIRAIYNKAVASGIVGEIPSPFTRFKLPKEDKTTPTRSTVEQFRAMGALELEPGSKECQVRDCWCFSVHCAGLRFGDLAKLQWKNVTDGRLVYRMSKTGDPVSVPFFNLALRYLSFHGPKDPSDFIFPILNKKKVTNAAKLLSAISSQNVVFNRVLKRLSGKIGLTFGLTFHSSRPMFMAASVVWVPTWMLIGPTEFKSTAALYRNHSMPRGYLQARSK